MTASIGRDIIEANRRVGLLVAERESLLAMLEVAQHPSWEAYASKAREEIATLNRHITSMPVETIGNHGELAHEIGRTTGMKLVLNRQVTKAEGIRTRIKLIDTEIGRLREDARRKTEAYGGAIT